MTDTETVAPPHPARWSTSVLDAIESLLDRQAVRPTRGLDPFCGPGLANLAERATDIEWSGVELEPEWAGRDPRVITGTALALPWTEPTFDLLTTSPTYGSRMADCHEAKDDSTRITYRHKLGRMPSDGSSAVMQWGGEYRRFHARAWSEALRVLKSRALVVVNVANHIRNSQEQRVTEWHLNEWLVLGATIEEVIKIPTPKMRFGANHELRTDGERLLVFRAPEKPAGTLL